MSPYSCQTSLDEVRRAIEHRLGSLSGLSAALVSRVHEPLAHDARRDILVLQKSLVRLRSRLAQMPGQA